ncbi:MAG: M20/M25/M40 family metallo-hydrolase, partial [Bacteroidota bacterium]
VKAREYVVSQFELINLKPKGEKRYLQEFKFPKGATFGASTQLYLNMNSYETGKDFYPLPYSKDSLVTGYVAKVGYGIEDTTLKQRDYFGKPNLSKKIFVMESGTPDGSNPHGKFAEWTDLRKKIDVAIAKGAAAVIFINSDTVLKDPVADFDSRITPSSIPVIFAKGNAAAMLRDSVITNCTVGVEIDRIMKSGFNVIGMIDNKAPATIVIGAHYDHLGYGAEGSLYRGEQEIHNGADDNASGTAGMIELARRLKANGPKTNNYLFIAFSGEEKGLLGSNHFVKHPTVDLSKINYMINLDMVGRLKPDDKALIISGSGTSPRWKTLMDSIPVDGIRIKQTESGVGPSDHTSFYLQNTPVLHFFSGTHADYHKPSDDADKINYEGEVAILNMILRTITLTSNDGRLAFTKTKDDQNENAPKFKVTLGVVPDYTFDGEGMRIDGVTDGKPASKAGLLPGDVVIQIGEHKVVDMMSYMKALGKFNHGDAVKVVVKRGEQLITKDVVF